MRCIALRTCRLYSTLSLKILKMDRELENAGRVASSMFAPAVIAIIGGVLMILGGLSVPLMYTTYQSLFNDGPMMGSGIMGGGGWRMIMPSSGSVVLSTMAIVSVGAGVTSVAGGYKMYKKPEKARNSGIVVLIASIIGLFGMSGFGMGAALGIVAGTYVLAIAKK